MLFAHRSVNEDWIIRSYAPGDRGALFAFFEEALAGMGYEFIPGGKDSDIGDIEVIYTGSRGSFRVVEAGGKVQGTVGVRYFSEGVCELKRLYLGKALRGRGVGHAL